MISHWLRGHSACFPRHGHRQKENPCHHRIHRFGSMRRPHCTCSTPRRSPLVKCTLDTCTTSQKLTLRKTRAMLKSSGLDRQTETNDSDAPKTLFHSRLGIVSRSTYGKMMSWKRLCSVVSPRKCAILHHMCQPGKSCNEHRLTLWTKAGEGAGGSVLRQATSHSTSFPVV